MIARVNAKANPIQSSPPNEIPSPITPKIVTMANEICTDRIASPYDLLCAEMNEKSQSF